MSARADLIIRGARADERAALEDLQRRASLAVEDYREELEREPDAIDLPQAHIADTLVAERGGAVAGFAVVLGGELDGLFVEPPLWRLGVGAALADAAAAVARDRGSRLSVIANPTAREFYERCGFKLEGTADTRFGPALRMSR